MKFAQVQRGIAMNCRHARHQAGMTQDAVAASGVVHKRYYQAIEDGTENPTIEMLHGLAGVFGVSFSWLTDVDSKEARGRQKAAHLLERRPPQKRNWKERAALLQRVAPVFEERKRRKANARKRRK